MLISHLTLSTGDIATHRLDTLDPAAVEACRSLLPSGGRVPSRTAFQTMVTGGFFTLQRGRDPIVACGVGVGRTEVWDAVCSLHLQITRKAYLNDPPAGTWLAVALLPGITALPRKEIAWLADWERCMAASILL